MLYMAGGDHLPLKFLPSRQLIGPRPPLPPIPTANFFTLGKMMMQSAFATTLAGTSLPPSIACNTVAAFLMVSSSLVLSAPQAGRVKTTSRDASKQATTTLVLGMGSQPPFHSIKHNSLSTDMAILTASNDKVLQSSIASQFAAVLNFACLLHWTRVT